MCCGQTCLSFASLPSLAHLPSVSGLPAPCVFSTSSLPSPNPLPLFHDTHLHGIREVIATAQERRVLACIYTKAKHTEHQIPKQTHVDYKQQRKCTKSHKLTHMRTHVLFVRV